MGMTAELIAIGPFSVDIVENLNYPRIYYNEVEVGKTICTSVCSMCTSSGSEMLAQALDIDAWNFGQHAIPADEIHVDKFANRMEDCNDAEFDYDRALSTIVVLKEKKFLFIYRPNG